MGTDLTVAIETLRGVRWSWEATLAVERDYDLFARIAGVVRGAASPNREAIEPIAPARGPLADLSPQTAFERDQFAPYVESWLSLNELLDQDWNGFTGTWAQIVDLMSAWKDATSMPSDNDVRIVLWFDS